MEFLWCLQNVGLAIAMSFLLVSFKIVYSFWIWPNMAYNKLRRHGLSGPSPRFPLGNIGDMSLMTKESLFSRSSSLTKNIISHDIHSLVFPYFAQWQKNYGKVFIYWMGTEPFLYIADPQFLKKMSAGVLGKSWGKPSIFRNDRKPMFGNGLSMVEGNDWVHHRRVITPTVSPANLKAVGSLTVALTNKMLQRWNSIINSSNHEIDVNTEITTTAAEIAVRTILGIGNENGKNILEKFKAMGQILYNSNRYIGVPFSKFICPMKYLKAKRIGEQVDALLLSIIAERIKIKESGDRGSIATEFEQNFLDQMLAGHSLTAREMIDECKTLFFAGHETSSLALIWTLYLLAMHPEWQNQIRDEIKQVVGDGVIDVTMVSGLKKMGWVMSEALRLYPSAPNLQRQARYDIQVNDYVVIPKGTNIWIDVVAMNHDSSLWGDTVHKFRPERFKGDLNGGCSHKMGYVPFGFGGRMCLGKNLSTINYKIMLTSILSSFSFSLSPNYSHSPIIMLSLKPNKGMPLIVQCLRPTK